MLNELVTYQIRRFILTTEKYEEVLQFWFPSQPSPNPAAMVQQWEWWFRGGANVEIIERFSPLLEQAIRGELDAWSHQPRSRLALILILDQFSRSIYQGSAQAFAQDSQACQLTLAGIGIGHYGALKTPWEKTFFFLPLGHSEVLQNLELAIKLADGLVQEAAQEHRAFLEFSAAQACRHRDILIRFNRHPHRNQALGRQSTPEELEYLASGQLVHTRSLPSYLSKSPQLRN
jgi:uncharacterized protein (DUF924 family)